MQLACSQDDMLSGLLLERLHARICLAEQLEATDEFWHVRRVLGLERDTDDGRGLLAHVSAHLGRNCIDIRIV